MIDICPKGFPQKKIVHRCLHHEVCEAMLWNIRYGAIVADQQNSHSFFTEMSDKS